MIPEFPGVTKLFLAPHSDDETLFGAFTILREKPFVLVCTRGDSQGVWGINEAMRFAESCRAMDILGVDCAGGPVSNRLPDWKNLEAILREDFPNVEKVWAPAEEPFGHAQHTIVGALADLIWPGKVTHYLCYNEGAPYTRNRGYEVPILDPTWVTKKLQALACYTSQIELAGEGYHHFINDQREYYEHEPSTA